MCNKQLSLIFILVILFNSNPTCESKQKLFEGDQAIFIPIHFLCTKYSISSWWNIKEAPMSSLHREWVKSLPLGGTLPIELSLIRFCGILRRLLRPLYIRIKSYSYPLSFHSNISVFTYTHPIYWSVEDQTKSSPVGRHLFYQLSWCSLGSNISQIEVQSTFFHVDWVVKIATPCWQMCGVCTWVCVLYGSGERITFIKKKRVWR